MKWSLIVVSAIASISVAVAGQQPQFRASTDGVVVDVSVADRARIVVGLTDKDFDLRDNGVPQTVLSVSYGTMPIDVTVGLDVSLSVDGQRLEQLRRAVTQLMRDLRADDRLSLLAFNMRVSRVLDFTSNRAEVDEALRSVTAGGGTSIWDATSTVLATPHPTGRRHLLMLFTDGADSTSITSPPDVIALAQRMNTTVSAVVPTAFFGVLRSVGPGQPVLQALARETGGRLVQVTTGRQDLAATFGEILGAFRSTYVLNYQPEGVDIKGLHAIDVTVKNRSGLTIQARRSYIR